jgi:hypothetical protein
MRMSATIEPEWLSLTEALKRYDAHMGFVEPHISKLANAPEREKYLAYCKDMNLWFLSRAASGVIRFKGAKQLGPGENVKGGLEAIPTDYFRTGRTFIQRESMIQAATYEEPMSEFVIKRKGGELHPNWLEVVVSTAMLMNELAQIHLKGGALADREGSATVKPPKIPPGILESWLKKRVNGWQSGEAYPTEQDDWAAAALTFLHYRVTRDSLRTARKKCCPPAWLNQGTKRLKSSA